MDWRSDKFKLFDAGCSGGAADYWYKIKDLKILGIDYAKEEIERLEKNKKNNDEFFYCYNIVNKNQPENSVIEKDDDLTFDDTGAFRIQSLFDELKVKSDRILTKHFNKPSLLKDIPKKTIKEICEQHDFENFNFIDLDLDGRTFPGLLSCENLLDNPNLFGIKIEVGFVNSKSEDFYLRACNFLQKYNFTLVKILPRAYSTYYLPDKFIYNIPAQSFEGYHDQGDLIFIKSLTKKSIEKINKVNFCKFIAFLELFNLHGFAIKLLNMENNLLDEKLKKKFIDLLTIAMSKKIFGKTLTHNEFIKKIIENPYSLYPK